MLHQPLRLLLPWLHYAAGVQPAVGPTDVELRRGLRPGFEAQGQQEDVARGLLRGL